MSRLASNTSLILLGMLSMRFQHSSVSMSRTQDDLMVLISDERLVGCFLATFLQFCPEILSCIKVQALSRPFQQFDIFRLEKVRDDFCPMA